MLLNLQVDEVFSYLSRNIYLFDRGSNGMLYTFYSVARREHIVGLWRGLVPVSYYFFYQFFFISLEPYGGSDNMKQDTEAESMF